MSAPALTCAYAVTTRRLVRWVARINERGPELLRLPGGSHVFSNPDSQRMAAAAGPAAVTVDFAGLSGVGSDSLDQVMATWFMKAVRTGQITISPQAIRAGL